MRIPVPAGGEAWVDLAAPRDTSPPFGEAPLPPRPLAARPADSRRLDAAVALLESPHREQSLGGYRLLHDLDEAAWRALEPTVRVALEGIEPLYSARYGVAPIGRPEETLILFRTEGAYRKLQLELPEVGGAPTTGHAVAGLVATYAGARDAREVGSTLAHEIGHLLTRRALGPALPPWLDEGLADDFSIEALARSSGGDPYAGWRTVSPERIDYGGPLAGLALLLRRLGAGQLVPLEELLGIPRETFYAEPDRERLYHQSGFRALPARGSVLSLGTRRRDGVPRLSARDCRRRAGRRREAAFASPPHLGRARARFSSLPLARRVARRRRRPSYRRSLRDASRLSSSRHAASPSR